MNIIKAIRNKFKKRSECQAILVKNFNIPKGCVLIQGCPYYLSTVGKILQKNGIAIVKNNENKDN